MISLLITTTSSILVIAALYSFKSRHKYIDLIISASLILVTQNITSITSETFRIIILFFIVFFSLYYSEKNPLNAGIFSSLLFINDDLARVFTNKIFSTNPNSFVSSFLVNSLVTLIIVIILAFIQKKIIVFLQEKFNRLNIAIFFLCIFLFFNFMKNTFLIELITTNDEVYINSLMSQIFFAFFFFLMIIVLLAQRSETMRLESESKKAIYENQLAYLKSIEKNAEEVRKFKHDYQNILLSMDSYFHEDKYEDLKKYYYTQIKHSSESLNIVNDQLNKLMRIQSMALRSIFYVKLSIIDSEKVNLTLEIDKKFFVEEKNEIPLVRSLGIILDNAVDALEELEQGSLQIALIENDGSNLIIVKNSCVANLPPLYQLEEKGFSTKGANRGIGLSNLKEIMEETDFLLETEIVDHYFIQKIIF